MSIKHTAASGTRLETLKALRDKLAGQIDDSDSGRDVAALSRQLTDVLIQIEDMEAGRQGSILDIYVKRTGGDDG